MNDSTRTPRQRRWRRPLVCSALLYVLVVACATFVPQHGWSKSFGPVVPHDSFPADCSLCHAKGDWHTLRADFTFDHAARTGVPLEGAHAAAGCLLCHNDRGPVQQFAAQGCAGCHADPHRQQLGRNCKDCHDETNWQPRDAIARHDRTRFPLVGAHAAVGCFRCHPGAQVGNFAGANSECIQCHMDDRARATDPDHVALGYSTDCSRCHLPTGWFPARFEHTPSFPLTHGHAGRACRECHQTPNSFTGQSTACASCHTDEHAVTTQPSHVAAGFGTDCSQCHDTRTFRTSSWPHPASFELTFGHAGRQCTECHVGQVYSGTSTTCSSCHLDTFQATQNPNHVTANYPTDCTQCHNTMAWRGAGTSHPATFPLENSHARACSSCHTTPGIYAGLNPACATCHLAQYQATTNPPHVSFGMSQQCQQCHGTTVWSNGSFVHTFPITSGAHRNMACFDCHNNAGNRLAFSCIDCHEHRQSKMANDHQGVNGYVWASANCYQCHPNGRH
ncbi:MAG: hypothetical protein H6838_20295 [Planctomycetes bacterium]|nr:hypothetical protein [Planctomycetota bacterium]MCB9887837.1 hypothetical protein [Planctomycetota bacterium]